MSGVPFSFNTLAMRLRHRIFCVNLNFRLSMANLDPKTREKLKRFYLIYSDILDTRKLETTEIDASIEAYEIALTALPLSAR
jgi:hypothetical protein